MKKFILILAVSLGFISYSPAQNNPLQSAFDAGFTNGAIGGGYWRGITGNYNIASYDFIYNFNTQSNALGAGLIVGGDYLWGGKTAPQWNDVKGGFAISYTIKPLLSIGFTNVVLKVSGGTAIATPHSSSVGVGNITFADVDWSCVLYKTLSFHLDPAFQTRVGQGEFDRNYAGIQFFFSLGF